MGSDPYNPVGEQAATLTQQPGPLDVIRTETVISKLPVHNLAKKGRVNIQILKTSADGQVELKWEVSYNERYGQARQLAYKLDTIVVNNAIDEAGRPLPERIRLGSLSDVCRELGLSEGETINQVKRAFLQNAFTSIVAKFQYKANDGTEHTFEAGFTRYSVIFTGQKFPDGTKADAVYITLNPDYRGVLNNAPVRPLDRGYMRDLPPAPQRFYEIISYKIFTALKYHQPTARLAYSEYCTFSAQQRYFEREQFRKQMFKIHQPHKKSGYIVDVHYDDITDSEGRPDWIMCYTPGPRARAEFATFAGKKPRTIEAATAPELPAGDIAPARRPRQRKLKLEPEAPPPLAPIIDYTIVSELQKRGVGDTDARALLATLPPNQPIRDQLEHADQLISLANSSRRPIDNPQGFYISHLQRNVPIPPGFETSRAQKARQEAEIARAKAIQQEQQARMAAEEAETTSLTAQIDALEPGDRLALLAQAKADLLARAPKMAQYLDTHPEADSSIRARARSLLKEGWAPPKTTHQPEEPHYAINPPVRQGPDLKESAPLQPTAAIAMAMNLEAILTTPQLMAPIVEQPPVEPPAPAESNPEIPARSSIEDHLL